MKEKKDISEWVRFNVPLNTLQVISETAIQAITCNDTDNKNQHKKTAQTNIHTRRHKQSKDVKMSSHCLAAGIHPPHQATLILNLTFSAKNWHTGYSCPGECSHQFWLEVCTGQKYETQDPLLLLRCSAIVHYVGDHWMQEDSVPSSPDEPRWAHVILPRCNRTIYNILRLPNKSAS